MERGRAEQLLDVIGSLHHTMPQNMPHIQNRSNFRFPCVLVVDTLPHIKTRKESKNRPNDALQSAAITLTVIKSLYHLSMPSADTCMPGGDGATEFRASRSVKLAKYLSTSIRVDVLVEIQLLILTLSTGIQDAISFPDFQCFASNQTGNTVLLAVGAAGFNGDMFHLPMLGVSLALFVTGAIMTGQIAHVVGARRRDWLFFTNLIQTAMVFGAAGIQFSHGVQESGRWAMGAISLLAFSSGAQVASCRPMQIPEITTAMATAAWVDFVIDPQLLAASNRPRNRRALFLALLVAGSFMGAYMHMRIGSACALVVSGAGKALVTGLLLFNREEPPKREVLLEAGESCPAAMLKGRT